MKIPISTVIDLLQAEMTEEKCDKLADSISSHIPGPKLLKGLVRSAIDEATPDALFKGLRALFPDNHKVSVPSASLVEDHE